MTSSGMSFYITSYLINRFYTRTGGGVVGERSWVGMGRSLKFTIRKLQLQTALNDS